MPLKYKKRRRRKRRPKRYIPKRRRRRPRRKSNIIRLTRQLIPARALVNHKFVRYIRIPQRITGDQPPQAVNADWQMPPMGADGQPPGYQNLFPNNQLLISCNDPLAPFNEQGTLGNWPGPDTRAFLNVPSTAAAQPPPTESQCLWYSSPLLGGGGPPIGAETGYQNLYTSFWNKMTNFYRRWTVIGSKATVSFSPDPVTSPLYARQASKHCIFTMGVRGGRGDLITTNQPQTLTEQPGFITREYNGRRQTNGRCYAFTMSRKWSAKKGFGLSKGDIISNSEITGSSDCQPNKRLHGFESPNQTNIGTSLPAELVAHPHSQQFYAWTGNSILTNNTRPGAYEPTEWPSGLIKVTLHYTTVWSSPQFTDNEAYPT